MNICIFYDFLKKIKHFREIAILGPPKVEAQFWKWEKIIIIFEFSATNSFKLGCPQKNCNLVPPLVHGIMEDGSQGWKQWTSCKGESLTRRCYGRWIARLKTMNKLQRRNSDEALLWKKDRKVENNGQVTKANLWQAVPWSGGSLFDFRSYSNVVQIV